MATRVLILSPRQRLVAEASEHILSFDWGDVARRTAEVYADLASSPATTT